MEDGALRKSLCDAARQLWMRGLIVGDGGLISVEHHRRRYFVTPPGRRRSDLHADDLVLVDLGGASFDGQADLDSQAWLPHRLAYQSNHSNNGHSPPPVRATILTTPANLTALIRLNPTATTFELHGNLSVTVVDIQQEQTIRDALIADRHVIIRNIGLLCADVTLDDVLNRIERIEHAATVELMTRPSA